MRRDREQTHHQVGDFFPFTVHDDQTPNYPEAALGGGVTERLTFLQEPTLNLGDSSESLC